MAVATTADYEDLVLEISPDNSTWSKICGITDFTVQRALTTDEDEIPDCNDESLPHTRIVNARAYSLTLTGTGKWASESHETMLQWIRTPGTAKYARIGYLNAAIGDVEYESGLALLTQLDHARQKGITVTAQITIQWRNAISTTDQTT